MRRVVRHIALPALAPALLVALYFTPVTLFGCVNRGWLAVGVVLLSAAAAFVTIGFGFRARMRGQDSTWWLMSTLVLTLPLVLVLGPLG